MLTARHRNAPPMALTAHESRCVKSVVELADDAGLVDRKAAAASIGITPLALSSALLRVRQKGHPVDVRFSTAQPSQAPIGKIDGLPEIEKRRTLVKMLDKPGKLRIEPPDDPRKGFVATPRFERFTRKPADPTRADVRALRAAWRKGDAARLARLAFSWPGSASGRATG